LEDIRLGTYLAAAGRTGSCEQVKAIDKT
jgi:hypothetical protein